MRVLVTRYPDGTILFFDDAVLDFVQSLQDQGVLTILGYAEFGLAAFSEPEPV